MPIRPTLLTRWRPIATLFPHLYSHQSQCTPVRQWWIQWAWLTRTVRTKPWNALRSELSLIGSTTQHWLRTRNSKMQSWVLCAMVTLWIRRSWSHIFLRKTWCTLLEKSIRTDFPSVSSTAPYFVAICIYPPRSVAWWLSWWNRLTKKNSWSIWVWPSNLTLHWLKLKRVYRRAMCTFSLYSTMLAQLSATPLPISVWKSQS